MVTTVSFINPYSIHTGCEWSEFLQSGDHGMPCWLCCYVGRQQMTESLPSDDHGILHRPHSIYMEGEWSESLQPSDNAILQGFAQHQARRLQEKQGVWQNQLIFSPMYIYMSTQFWTTQNDGNVFVHTFFRKFITHISYRQVDLVHSQTCMYTYCTTTTFKCFSHKDSFCAQWLILLKVHCYHTFQLCFR